MAVSRTADIANRTGQQGNVTSNATTTGTNTTTGTTTTTGRSNTVSSNTERRNIDYLDSASRAALNSLIAGLTGNTGGGGGNFFRGGGSKGGGTNQVAEQANKITQERLNEIATNQAIRGDYSKADAFADATGAMNANLARVLEQAMPTITAGIDAAGTSGSALSALLTQKAADDAAASAAELGLQAAISYGQIQSGFSNVISNLLSQGSESANLLMQALGIAKGSVERGTITSNGSSSQSSNSTQTTNSTQTSTTNESRSATETTTPTLPTTTTKKREATGYGLLGNPVVNASTLGKSAGGTATSSYKQFM